MKLWQIRKSQILKKYVAMYDSAKPRHIIIEKCKDGISYYD